MKKILLICSILMLNVLISGSGYMGTLPDLDVKDGELPKPVNVNAVDVLPLDKLTLPNKKPAVTDKVLVQYKSETDNFTRQLEEMKSNLDKGKSFKMYIASANLLDLTARNILSTYKEERFSSSNKVIQDINHDVQSMKSYWIKIHQNSPYVSDYYTQHTYSDEALIKQLNRFSNVLEHAIKELKTQEYE